MDTRKIATEYRLSQWMNVVQEQQLSGQTIKDFCQEKGISRHAYFYWRRKIREAACIELAKQEPVVSAASSSKCFRGIPRLRRRL